MLNKKSALPHSENSNHLNMEETLDGRTVLQFAEECPICTEKYYEKAVINSCKHVFCFSCVLTWAEQENSCPLCKTKFTVLKKMVRIKGEDANPKEVQATIKRIAHKKQRPPEMTFAEFEQFQFDIELNELDEWIIDDEVYSEAMDVAPVDHLEVLEESLAEMTRHSHRERRHRNNNQTAHRKTKRRKLRSPEMREDIGPTRNRYTRHHHNNNNNNSDGEETPTQSIDISGEVTVEPPKSKYNLRETRTVKGLPTDFIELPNEDIEEKEQKDEDTIVSVTVVNDGCHVDRRSIVSTPTKIVKATELNLPVDQFDNKPGEHDNNDGLSEDEVVEGEGACIEHNFIDDMDINYIQSKDDGPQKVHEGQNNSEKNVVVPQFTLTDIPFIDDDADKVMPIEGATDLQSVNNVSINNELPLANSDDSNSLLKPPSKPQPPFPSAKKTPMLAKPLPELEGDQKPSAAPAKPAKAKRRSKSVTPVDPTPAQKPSTTVKPIDSAAALTPPMTTTKPPKKAAKPVARPTPAQKPPMTTKPAVDSPTAPKPSTTAKSSKKTAKSTVGTAPAAVITPKSPPTQPADPTLIPKSPTTADPVADTATALKPPPKPQLPALPARKALVAPPKFLSEPATSKPASTKTKIIELATLSESLVGPKGQILSKFNQSLPVSEVPASEESVSEPKAAESGENQANGTTYKRKNMAGPKGRRSSEQSSAQTDEKPQPSPKLIATDCPRVQNNGIDLQRLNKISFKKKSTAVQPANDPVPQTSETVDSASNSNNMTIEPNVDSTSSASNNNIAPERTLDIAPNNTSNNATVTSTEIVKDQSSASNARSTNTSESVVESKSLAPSSKTEAAPVAAASVTDGISNLLEKIAPVMSMDFEGYQQHGSFARDEVDFNDNELMADDASSQQQHFDSQERDRNEAYYNEQDHHEYDDRREYNNNRSYQSNYYERQFRHKNNYERRSNYSTATNNKGYNQYRDGPRHNRNGQFIGHYDNEIRPQGYHQNGRGSRQHHNGGRYGGSNRPYDRLKYNGPYLRQQPYDNRAPYPAPYEVPIALPGPPFRPPPALQHSFPLPVQQAVPVQVLQPPQQVVQQVVSVQQVPTVPMPVAAVVKSAPEEESKQDDSFYRARNKRKQKTPEPETSTVARVEPTPIAVQTQVAIKTEVAAVPIKMEVPSTAPPMLPAPPQPTALTPPPLASTSSTAVQESNMSAQPQPQADVSSRSEVVASRKRSRSRSPADDTKQKRRKVVHEMLDLRADKRREEDEDMPSVRDKHDSTYQEKRGDQEKPNGKETDKHEKYDSRYTDKYDHKDKQDRHKDKQRSSDKDKERRSKDKDKRRDKEKDKRKDKLERRHKDKKHRDKDSTEKHKAHRREKDKKTDERPSSATREDEQLIECVSDPKPVVGPIVAPVMLKKSIKSTVVVANSDPKTTPIKKRKIASKVSVPQ